MTASSARRAPARPRRPAVPAGDPILTSKITPPRAPGWTVQRPRITELIAQGTRWCPLTVVTGPPGAGKTMALALWAAADAGTVAWVGLDEYDNRPEVFWSHVVAALRRSGVAVPTAVPAAARGRAGDRVFVQRLAAALAARDLPVTLALDDLHLLAEPRVLDGLDFVLRNAGAGLRLAVASRMNPLLPLHRYRLAGQLAEIRAADLAFSVPEARLLLAAHDVMLPTDCLERLTRQTEGWAAGLRLAAISLAAHPCSDQVVRDLAAEDSPLTGYLVQEVLGGQPPEVREVLLCTSILEQVSAEAAVAVAGNDRAAGILMALVRANAFIEPAGSGRYRYHPLFAEVLRRELRREHPDRMAALHCRAARWYGRASLLTDAVRHAARAGDWQLAASLVIDDLAIGQLLEPAGGHHLAGEFRGMPPGQAWAGPEPHLVWAAVALSAGRPESSGAALAAADGILQRAPADQQAASRLAAAVIRLTSCLRTGDLQAAALAASRAEVLVSAVPDDKLARHPDIRARVLAGRGDVELWSGHLDQAAHLLEAGIACQTSLAGQGEPAGSLGHLALVEALRGRLGCAVRLAGRATAASTAGEHRPPMQTPNPAALVALAWVHLERSQLREAALRLKQADAALGLSPDKLIGTVACLAAAGVALAEGRAEAATQVIAKARSGWPVPAWLDQRLSLLQSLACAAAGDIPAALAAAGRSGRDDSPEAAVTLAHAWAAAGDANTARRALAPALMANGRAAGRVRVHARLLDARLSYASGDRARGWRSLASALRLAGPEQLRLPFVVEHSWIEPVLRRDPGLAQAHRRLFGTALRPGQLPAPVSVPQQAAIAVIEPLSEREREVLRHVSGLLSSAEIARELSISVNTVKTHLQHIYGKLAAAGRGEAVRRARQLELI
jgi:LuxR family maltose regulon positive regulatory protein